MGGRTVALAAYAGGRAPADVRRSLIAYDVASGATTMTLGNGAGVTFTFDDADETTGIHHHTAGGGLIASYGYAYNDAGVRTSVVEGSGDVAAHVLQRSDRFER
jgi:hypothetical protein